MYHYIIDPEHLNQRQFERVQNQLYSCLSEYRISGETTRVTSLRTVSQLVENAFTKGVKTLVAVGGDETLFDLINAVGNREVVIGFIPIYKSEVAEVLGVTDIDQACKTIASRRIINLDLGRINQTLFITKLSFGVSLTHTNPFSFKLIQQLFNLPVFEVKFTTQDYKATLKVVGGQIINSRGSNCSNTLGNPTDGILDVLLLPKLERLKLIRHRTDIVKGCYESIPESSLLHLQKIEITSPDGLPLRVGNRIVAKTPAAIEILPKALKIIAGKDRRF
jgi:diacylglycerol kinase family enzyme